MRDPKYADLLTKIHSSLGKDFVILGYADQKESAYSMCRKDRLGHLFSGEDPKPETSLSPVIEVSIDHSHSPGFSKIRIDADGKDIETIYKKIDTILSKNCERLERLGCELKPPLEYHFMFMVNEPSENEIARINQKDVINKDHGSRPLQNPWRDVTNTLNDFTTEPVERKLSY